MQEFTQKLKNLQDFKDVLEKYGEIEKDYSRKLNNLRKNTISEFPFFLDFLIQISQNSLENSLEMSKIIKNLEVLISRKTQFQKSLDKFFEKLHSEVDNFSGKVENSREQYTKNCDQVQVLQLKLHKISLSKISKFKHGLNSKIIDMNNQKNNYLLEISSSNSTLETVKTDILPQVSNNFHDSCKTMLTSLLKVNFELQKCFQENFERNSQALSTFSRELQKVNVMDYISKDDSFLLSIFPEKEFTFIDSGLWKDTDEFVLDDNSRIFMWNSKEKLESRILKLDEELKVLDNGIQGLEALRTAYTSDEKNKDDVDVVEENILESQRARLLVLLSLSYYSNQLKEISPHVQDMGIITAHEFKSSMFTIPTTCELCSQYIWGISKPGMTCKVCGMNVHLKCQMKVHPECSTTKEKRIRAKTGSMISLSNSRLSVLSNNTDVSSPNVSSIPNGAKAVALYDYIPNSSAVDELDMLAGDELMVVAEDDGSGWTKVSRLGREGLVPTSYIEIMKEIDIEPMSPFASIVRKEVEAIPSPVAAMASIIRKEVELTPPTLAATAEKTKFSGSLARVLFDYQRKENDELTVYAGQSVWIVIEDDGSGWTQVTNGAESGHVPSSYISIAEY